MHFKSNFEELVFQAIKVSTLKHLIVKKEVQWSKIFNDLHFKNRYVDFFFPQIQLIIEANGIQHYEPTSFTNDESMILGTFHNQQNRDRMLLNLCSSHEVNIIVIPYTLNDLDEIANFLNIKTGDLYGSKS